MDKDSALGTSKLTRFLYVILAIAFVLGLSPIGTSTAYADDSDNSVTVTVNVYDGKDGKFLDMYREVTVTPGIAEEYGYTNDSTYVGDTQVSALDVLVAEHKAYYGDAFTTTSHDQLSVSSSGWIQLMFNTEPAVSGYTYFVNQANPVGTDGSTGLMVNQAVVSNGDYIDFVITPDDYYSELGESYGHMYGMTIDFAYFGDSNGDRVASIGTEPGASVTVNLKRFWALANMMGGTRTVEDFSDVSLAYVDAGTGEIGTDVIATTGEDGTATLTFSDPGTYYVSATGKYESIYQRDQQYYEDVEIPMIEPLIKITVKEPVGSITLTVENTTYTDSSQSMTSGAEPAWTGTLIDQVSVPIYEGDTVYSAAKRGIEAAGFTMESGSYGGIGTVNGLAAGDANGMTTSGGYEYNASGWMELVNDWFINTLPEQVSVSDGDEITVAYSVTGGPDIGGDWSNTDKSLKSIATSTGTLSPEFSSSTYEYTLTVPKGTRSLTVTPTASNKDYQVHTYLGDQATGTEYARSAEIPVDDGSVITVVCGDESWPTMNDNSSEKQTYTITIEEEQRIGSITLTVENTTYTDSSQSMTEGAEPAWTGTLIDQVSVPIYEGDTVLSAAQSGIEAAGFTMESGSYGGIGTVNGLAAGDANGMTTYGDYEYNASGWMELVNDWFINTMPESVSVSDGDEITVAYSVTGGPDLGGDSSNTDKTLKSLTTSAGTLSPEFSSSTYEYTLTVPRGTTSVKVTPTASNKNYQVHTYLGDQATGTEYARSSEIPVEDGSVITVVCGDESWPTM
ncbi:MAG: cadherin-like beta sandwich domain-containing protein, partial [Coriobacteriales bacterium]